MDSDNLETWIVTVNETGAEYGLTLVVSGTLVTGHLTPSLRYRDWLREVGRRATITRSKQHLPGSGIGPISEQQAERARGEWQARPGADGEQEPISRFCLRDAAVTCSADPSGWTHLPFLMVRLASVDAFSPVRLKT